ncbi:Predicted metal-dependent hydrolase, TIM-barrel fold [Roseovarius lutimaris]|uniref:Predicted metal-dependent hydrolase, TIM-barrel fold n=1 Tax=Roseovarius lutimaris TaxID=1005928 RepID=A0A1I5GP14_9RHOB|nr:amidohydrolase family protein [Roseovarius lutimaris]SFO37758.1 Predicted metal-dependent hydrolase, TIM-barrel fold [Roseovarius lutimaris]
MSIRKAVPPNPHIAVREDWLAATPEVPVDAAQPIIDAHHHLWHGARGQYMFDEFLADVSTGHNVVATVFAECRSMWREDGLDAMKPVGETEFVAGVAAISESGEFGPCRIGAGIVGHADLTEGAAVADVLEAHIACAGGRFRGIRQSAVWSEDETIKTTSVLPPRGLMQDAAFREGFAKLVEYGLSFDAWIYHPQIGEFIDLARAFPDTVMVLDHLGGILGINAYAGRRDEVFEGWRRQIVELSTLPNVRIKLGGLGMKTGFGGYHLLDRAPGSDQLAHDWLPWIETAIEVMGSDRCMFESNFPVDKGAYSYTVCWNAFQKITAGATPTERQNLFHDTAYRTYRLENDAG